MTSVAIVILNWNGIDDTIECLKSIAKLSYTDYQVILIDNASSEEGTAQRLKKLEDIYDSKLHIIRNIRNDGFAGGVNIGIRYALEHKFTYITLLNNDAVVDKKWLENIVTAAEPKQIGMVTCKLLDEAGKKIDSTGDWYSTWGLAFPRSRDLLAIEAPKSGYVFGGTGGATLYKASLFKDIGLFDETFFAYYEDVDISFRAQLRGWKAYYEASAVAYHKRGASSNKISGFTTYQTMKNLPLLYIKNVPGRFLLPIGAKLLICYLLFFASSLRRGSGFYSLKGSVAAFYLFFRHGLIARLTIQRRKTVASNDIAAILYPDIPPDQTGIRRVFRRNKV